MDDLELLGRADEAAQHAYAPYSGFSVGAALLGRDGRIWEGVNVENASYPLGICAERAAIGRAVSEAGGRPGDFETIAITASPCGGCRQWLVEFRLDRVVYRDNHGDIVTRAPDDLLPDTFSL
ncbi:MAG: cytidine deaminase [Gaiellaceae bacterium]|jgi:cytidine deaminase|nr:cytidine deaminase [Gaiellaceae bacterium]